MAISAAQITTSADIAWASGEPFDGYLVLKLVPPDGRLNCVWEDTGVRAASRYVVPVVAGVLDVNVKIPYTASLTPPGSQYRAFWYDKALIQIAAAAGFITITADPTVITPATLTDPTAAVVPPSMDTNPEVVASTGAFTVEEIAGTKNGSNTAFTISRNATIVIVTFEGQVIDEGTGYTRSGTAITAVAPKIPASDSSYKAILVG